MRWHLLAVWCLSGIAAHGAPKPFAAVSIRVYQETGPSQVRIFIYALDGRLIRTLPERPGIDDQSPVISHDGRTILFSHHASDPAADTGDHYSLCDVATGKITAVAPAEIQSQQQRRLPTLAATEFHEMEERDFKPDAAENSDSVSCHSSDGLYSLVRRPNPKYSESNPAVDEPEHFYFLKTRGSGVLSLAELPAYHLYATSWDFFTPNDSPFIPLGHGALFMGQHMNSTDGSALWIFNLNAKRWIEMSGNSGSLYSVEGQPEVLFIRSSLYEDLGKSGVSVNCAYLELWGPDFRPVRLGPSVSIFHGASIFYGRGKTATLVDPGYGS